MHHYPLENIAAFKFSAAKYGQLSNMNNNFSLVCNYILFQSSEGLYQALKYPMQPNIQAAIADAKTGYHAKKKAYNTGIAIPENWEQIKVDAMRLTLAVKVARYPNTLSNVLLSTRNLPIVEHSSRDQFWGASIRHCQEHGDTFECIGHNILGRLWTKLRNIAQETNCTVIDTTILERFLEPVQQNFVVNNQPLTKESVLQYHTDNTVSSI